MPPALSRKGCFLREGGPSASARRSPLPQTPPPSQRALSGQIFLQTTARPHRCKHAVIRRPGTCRDAVKRWCCTRPGLPLPVWSFRAGQARQKPFAPRPGAASLPVYGYQCRPALIARLFPSPRPFFSRSPNQPIGFLPLCGNMPVPPFAHEGCRRRPQAPAQKKRNFLDLWQTIAQDLSRLFAVPGGCPSCPGSRNGLARALVPLPPPRARSESVARSLPESALRCLAGTRMHTPTRTWRHGRAARPSTVQPLHGTGGPERDGCPGLCDTVAWT